MSLEHRPDDVAVMLCYVDPQTCAPVTQDFWTCLISCFKLALNMFKKATVATSVGKNIDMAAISLSAR